MAAIPFTETLKNTIEVLNEIYEINNSQFQWETFLNFLWTVLKDWAIYAFTLQWLNDFVHFPIILPQGFESIFSDFFIFSSPTNLSLFPSDSIKTFWGNYFFKTSFFSGFLNCFFLYFPLSSTQFIWLRRIIIDGQWSGTGKAATIGIIFGHLSLLGFCLFGFRNIINLWFGLEPLSYFLGIWLIFIVVFEMAHNPRPFIKIKKSQKKELLKIFLINFGLVWTDQSGFYQFFGNLSLNSGISPLDFSFYNSQFSISLYFFGVLVGSFFWTFLISQGFRFLGSLFITITRYSYSSWIRGFHNFCLIGCITLTLTSFPYYGFDYLFTNPLGFVPQDSIWEATSIPQLKTDMKDVDKGRLGEKSSYASIDTDLSLFDRGRYAGGPFPGVEFHIESLNYKEEYAWRSRFDRLSSRNLRKGGGLLDKFLTTRSMEDALKKQRREKKQAQQAKKIQKLIKDKRIFLTDEFKEYQEEKGNSLNVVLSQFLEKPEDEDYDYEDEDYDYEDYDYDSSEEEEEEEKEVDFDIEDNLVARFVRNYAAAAEAKDVPDFPVGDEKRIRFSAFSELAKYGFDLFSMFEAAEIDPADEELAKEIKEKYSENLVYRFLVNFDISNFLKRQPKNHKLTSRDEISLFAKRGILNEYYDTLRSYSELPFPINDIFQPLFCGPKSYSNRIYNQQFKGTLKIVERLFSIHLEDEDNIPTLPDPPSAKRSGLHEAGTEGTEGASASTEGASTEGTEGASASTEGASTEGVGLAKDDKNENETLYLKLKKEPSVLKFDQPLYKYKKDFLKKNPLIHEEFLDEVESSMQEADSIPFLQEVLPRGAPFFVGWDDKQRKFLVTNRLLTRDKTLSNSNISVLKNDFREFSTVKNFENLKKWKKKQSEKPRPKKNKQTFTFTTWPVTEEAIQKNPLLSRLYRVRSEIDMTLVQAQTPTAFGKGEDLFNYAEPIMDIDIDIEEQEEEEEEDQDQDQDKVKVVYKTLPSIVKRIEYKNPEKLQLSLAPTRGGFIWPGNEQSKYKLQFKIPFRFEEMFKYFFKDKTKTRGFKLRNK